MMEDTGAAGTEAGGSDREEQAAGTPEPDGQTALEAELAADLAAERARADDLLALSQRLKADFDNYRRRAQAEQQRSGEAAVGSFVHQLLPVVDNLERAAAATGDEGAVRQGVAMTLRQFQEALVQAGVAAFSSVGADFDPERHEAVARGPAPGVPDGQVAEEYRKGYTFRGQVIRAALVKVSRQMPLEPAEDEGQPPETGAEAAPGGPADASDAQEGR